LKTFDPIIYRRLFLQKAKLQKLEDLDVFDELSDIDYLTNLKNKVSTTITSLIDKELLPKNFEELVTQDIKRVSFIRDAFKIEEGRLGLHLETTKKNLDEFSSPASSHYKKDINIIKVKLNDFEKLWNKVHPEIIKFYYSPDWSNSSNLETYLNEIYHLEKNNNFLKNTNHYFGSYMVSPSKFINDVEKLINDLTEQLDLWSKGFKLAQATESQIKLFCKEGKIEPLRAKILEVMRFKDIATKEKKQVVIFDRLLGLKKEIQKHVGLFTDESNKCKYLNRKIKEFSRESQSLNQALRRVLSADPTIESYNKVVSKFELKIKRKKQLSSAIKRIFLFAVLSALVSYFYFENQQEIKELFEEHQPNKKALAGHARSLAEMELFFGESYRFLSSYSLEKLQLLKKIIQEEVELFGISRNDYLGGWWRNTLPASQYTGLWVVANSFDQTNPMLRPTSVHYLKNGKKDGLSIQIDYKAKKIWKKSIFKEGRLISVLIPEKPMLSSNPEEVISQPIVPFSEEPVSVNDPEEEKRNIVRQYQAGEISREQALERLKKLRE
jgi:hypothetical protein